MSCAAAVRARFGVGEDDHVGRLARLGVHPAVGRHSAGPPASSAAIRDRPHGDRLAAAGLDHFGQQVDVGPARGVESALEAVDAVLPDARVDGLLLGGDIGPELRAAVVGAQLDPERRARRHLRKDRADDDSDVGPLEPERRAEAADRGRKCGAVEPWRVAVRRTALSSGASGRSTRIPSRDASQAAW